MLVKREKFFKEKNGQKKVNSSENFEGIFKTEQKTSDFFFSKAQFLTTPKFQLEIRTFNFEIEAHKFLEIADASDEEVDKKIREFLQNRESLMKSWRLQASKKKRVNEKKNKPTKT